MMRQRKIVEMLGFKSRSRYSLITQEKNKNKENVMLKFQSHKMCMEYKCVICGWVN